MSKGTYSYSNRHRMHENLVPDLGTKKGTKMESPSFKTGVLEDEKRTTPFVITDIMSGEGYWFCPECGSRDVYEISYHDDFGSMTCNACLHTGDPGEDFPHSSEGDAVECVRDF